MASPHPIPSPPRFEHHHNGFGLDINRPRLSWSFSYPKSTDINPAPPWVQFAYDIEIKSTKTAAESQVFHIESPNSVLVPWPSIDLISREAVSVRVKCYAVVIEGCTSWSEWSSAEIGLLKKQDWTAVPIALARKFEPEDTTLHPLRFRNEFSVPNEKTVVSARLYATAFGVYEAYINGQRVGDHILAPGWTSYHHRLAYQIFDVTPLITAGTNAISAEVAEGWYAGTMGIRGGQRFNYGKEVAFLAQLEITFDDSDVQIQSTDWEWKCHTSAITGSEIYNGETYDAREEQEGWKNTGFDAATWTEVKVLSLPTADLIASDMAPIRVIEKVKPISVATSPSGKTIFDFGQNLVGFVSVGRVPVHSRISLVHAEVLVDGEMGMRPLREAKCTDTIITADKELLYWSPKFTYHGFRYMQVEGWPEGTPPSLENFTALVFHTDMKRRGWFKCSNDLVNELHGNIVWGMRGNFLSVPTDCPQRNERLGWTGDIQVFGPTANFLYDTNGIVSTSNYIINL